MQPSSLGGALCLEGEGVETAAGAGEGRGASLLPPLLLPASDASVGVSGGEREAVPLVLLLLPLSAPASARGGESPRWSEWTPLPLPLPISPEPLRPPPLLKMLLTLVRTFLFLLAASSASAALTATSVSSSPASR